MANQLDPSEVVHRIGGAAIANLRLKAAEAKLQPPGISVLRGGTKQQAVDQMRAAYPDPVLFSRANVRCRLVFAKRDPRGGF